MVSEKQEGITYTSPLRLHELFGLGKEGNVLFNDALNTFYLRLYGRKEGKKEMFYLTWQSSLYLRLYGRKDIFI